MSSKTKKEVLIPEMFQTYGTQKKLICYDFDLRFPKK